MQEPGETGITAAKTIALGAQPEWRSHVAGRANDVIALLQKTRDPRAILSGLSIATVDTAHNLPHTVGLHDIMDDSRIGVPDSLFPKGETPEERLASIQRGDGLILDRKVSQVRVANGKLEITYDYGTAQGSTTIIMPSDLFSPMNLHPTVVEYQVVGSGGIGSAATYPHGGDSFARVDLAQAPERLSQVRDLVIWLTQLQAASPTMTQADAELLVKKLGYIEEDIVKADPRLKDYDDKKLVHAESQSQAQQVEPEDQARKEKFNWLEEIAKAKDYPYRAAALTAAYAHMSELGINTSLLDSFIESDFFRSRINNAMENLEALDRNGHFNYRSVLYSPQMVAVERSLDEAVKLYLAALPDFQGVDLSNLGKVSPEVRTKFFSTRRPYDIFINTVLGLDVVLDMTREGDIDPGRFNINGLGDTTADHFFYRAQNALFEINKAESPDLKTDVIEPQQYAITQRIRTDAGYKYKNVLRKISKTLIDDVGQREGIDKVIPTRISRLLPA